MTEDNKKQRLIWIDLEMTGLEPDENHIIEVATIVTDAQLNTLAEGPVMYGSSAAKVPGQNGRLECENAHRLRSR